MKAAIIREFGTPDIFRIEDVATPQPAPGNVLIKILAAGVNRFDQYIREGSVVPQLSFPHILGADAAGEIAEIGEGVTGFRIGERVVPMTGYPNDEADADIHPTSAVTGVGEVKAGDHVLITAGSSGAGTFTIQVAKLLGAHVATTTRSDGKAEALRELGADLVINTRKEDLVQRVQEWTGGQGADVAVD